MPGRLVPRGSYWWQCYLGPRLVEYQPAMKRRLEIVSEATSGELDPPGP
jgi:hypothetical protein